jgi:hypothetical protein
MMAVSILCLGALLNHFLIRILWEGHQTPGRHPNKRETCRDLPLSFHGSERTPLGLDLKGRDGVEVGGG